MNDQITAWIRTTVPMLVGAVVTWLAKSNDIVLDADTTATVATAATFVVSVAWYTAVKALESRWPKAGVLIGVARPPVYAETEKAVRARIAELAGLPLPEYQTLVAANPDLVDDDHRDGCQHPTQVPWPLPINDPNIVLEPPVYDEST